MVWEKNCITFFKNNVLEGKRDLLLEIISEKNYNNSSQERNQFN